MWNTHVADHTHPPAAPHPGLPSPCLGPGPTQLAGARSLGELWGPVPQGHVLPGQATALLLCGWTDRHLLGTVRSVKPTPLALIGSPSLTAFLGATRSSQTLRNDILDDSAL